MSAEIDRYELELAQNQAELVRLRHAVRDLEARLQYEQFNPKRRILQRPGEPLTPETPHVRDTGPIGRQIGASSPAAGRPVPEPPGEPLGQVNGPVQGRNSIQQNSWYPGQVLYHSQFGPGAPNGPSAPSAPSTSSSPSGPGGPSGQIIPNTGPYMPNPAPSVPTMPRTNYPIDTVASPDNRVCIACKATESACWRASWGPGKLCNSCGLKYRKSGTYCARCSRVLSPAETSTQSCVCGGKVVRKAVGPSEE